MVVQGLRLAHFVVYGTAPRHGMVSLPANIERRDPYLGERMSVEPAELELRDVPRPSALGGGWRRSLELLYLIAVTEFKKTYFGTVLGYLWSLARPLMLFAVLVTVFTTILRLATVPALRGAAADEHRPVRLLPGGHGDRRGLGGGPGGDRAQDAVSARWSSRWRSCSPRCSTCCSTWSWWSRSCSASASRRCGRWLLFPVVLLLLVVLTVAVAMIVSSLYPRFRDVAIIWTVFSTALFYATPIMYAVDRWSATTTLRHIILLNPLAPIFELARKWIIQPSAPGPVAAAGGWLRALVPAGDLRRPSACSRSGSSAARRLGSPRRCDRRDPNATLDCASA